MEHHRSDQNTNDTPEAEDPQPPSRHFSLRPGSALRRYLDQQRRIEKSLHYEPVRLQGLESHEDALFKTTLQNIVDDLLDEPPQIVYNPGCGRHVSLASAFPQTRTIFVDEDESIAEDFAQHNKDNSENPFEFYQADMHSFRLPEKLKADITLLFNTTCMTEFELDKVTNNRGIIIANNRYNTVQYMQRNCPNYGMIKKYCYQNTDFDLHVFRRKY